MVKLQYCRNRIEDKLVTLGARNGKAVRFLSIGLGPIR